MTRIALPRSDQSAPVGSPVRLLVIPDFSPLSDSNPQGPSLNRQGPAVAGDPISPAIFAASLENGRAADSKAASSEALPKPPDVSMVLRSQQALDRVSAAARRLARTVPRGPGFGWQRTILLIVGGAFLAHSLTGMWRGKRGEVEFQVTQEESIVGSPIASEIHRMSRAPLRVEQTDRSPVTPPSANHADDEIFHVPEIGSEPASDVVDEAARPPHAGESGNDFPVIGAPDGSELSRQRRRSPTNPGHGGLQNGTEIDASIARRQAHGTLTTPSTLSDTRTVLDETLVEEDLTRKTAGPDSRQSPADSGQAAPQYPRTQPDKYSDPDYVIPSMATRPSQPRR